MIASYENITTTTIYKEDLNKIKKQKKYPQEAAHNILQRIINSKEEPKCQKLSSTK